MAINFPNNPAVNDTFTVGGTKFTFTGVKWETSAVVDISSDTTPQLGGTLDANSQNINNVNDLVVGGNLTVNGTTTTIDTAVTAVDSLAVEGNVGIGTTIPAAKLEVSTGGAGGTEARITSTIDNNADLALYTNSVKRGVLQGNSTGVTVGTTANLPTKIITNDTSRVEITTGGDVLVGGHSQYTYDDTADSNVILDVYGGTTSGKRGILSLSGRTNGNVGDLGSIWFNNDDNSGAGVGTQMKLSAVIQAKSVTSDSNADDDAGGDLRLYTKPEGGALEERLHITSTGIVSVTGTVTTGTVDLAAVGGQGSTLTGDGRLTLQFPSGGGGGVGMFSVYLGTSKNIEFFSGGSATFAGTISDSIGPLRRLGINYHNAATYTLVASDAGKLIREATNGANITIPQNVFSAGDMITIFNVSGGNNTITSGAGITLYNTADGATGNRTLAAKGVCTIACTSTNEFIISGSGLS